MIQQKELIIVIQENITGILFHTDYVTDYFHFTCDLIKTQPSQFLLRTEELQHFGTSNRD